MTPREAGVTDGCRPEGNRAEVEIVSTSELLPGNVVWGEDGWYAVLDSDQNDSTQVSAAQIIDDAGGQDEDSILYGEWFLRLAHPAATAREESIRAEVIEECARVCEARAAKHHGTFTEDLGESYELGWREDEGKDCAKAIRALALARATGAES